MARTAPVLIGAALLGALIAAPAPAQAKRLYCKDFKTYSQALSVYKKNKAAKKGTWQSLDRDNDGRPCECLPGSPVIDQKACKGKKARKAKTPKSRG